MKASPLALTSRAPAPRTASETRNLRGARWYSAVGWNCTYSALTILALARSAMTMPEPMLDAVLVVCR